MSKKGTRLPTYVKEVLNVHEETGLYYDFHKNHEVQKGSDSWLGEPILFHIL